MAPSKPKAYALFNNNQFSSILYYPSEGEEQFVMLTAALQSNPTISIDETNDIPTTTKYSVFVGEDYAGSLNILKGVINGYDFDPLHTSLQNNPTVVWINSEILPRPDTKWSYDGVNLVLVEE